MKRPSVLINSSREGLAACRALARELEQDADATVWAEGSFQLGRSSLESLEDASRMADAAIFILTPDDPLVGRAHGAGANLLFEVGYLIGRLGRSKTFLVVPSHGPPVLPSDLAGTAHLQYDSDSDVEVSMRVVAAAMRDALRALSASEREERYSCFVSYSASDKDFSLKLSTDLQGVGFRCWLDAKDIPAGGDWREHIGRALGGSDKIILVLSHSSTKSSWVRHEMRLAMELERQRSTAFLVPVRLDDSVLEASDPDSIEIQKRQIADFRNWRDPSGYKEAFSHLVRSLMISRAVEARKSQ